MSQCDSPLSPGAVVFFESYLHIVTDVALVLKNWKKRWFTLYRLDPFNPNSMELTYYSDSERKERKGSINITQITKVSPISGKSKDHIFSIETNCGKKLVMKAADARTKNIWLAKLLEGCSKDGQTIHVTVPSQPTSSYTEALLKLGAPMAVKVVSPSIGQTAMEIPFQQIRRFGCQVYLDSDIVWFETCNCKGSQQQFYFFVVASGIEKALSITHDLKKSIEYTTRSLLIQEEGDEMNYQYSYISRIHYGCSEYSAFARDRVLSASLMHLAASTSASGAISIRELNKLKRQRVSVPAIQTVPPSSMHQERRSTLADLHGKTSPDPSLSPVPGARSFTRSPSPGRFNNASPTHSPNHSGNRITLADRFRGDNRGGMGLSHSAGQVEFDSGITLEAVDPSRFSAPVPGSPRQKMENIHKMKSFDEKLGGHSPQMGGRGEGPRKTSLAQMHDTNSVVNFVNTRKFSRDRRNDSANGSAELIIDEEPIHSSSGRYPRLSPAPPTSYDHLPPARGGSPRLPPRGNGGISLAAYDHLDSSFAGLSLKNALGKRKDAAYVES